VNRETIEKRFGQFLRSRSLKLTSQRRRLFDRAFATHEHFSAEQLYRWLQTEPGPRVSRATVYRSLALLVEGGFVQALDTGKEELLYEHVLGHPHHDHMVCLDCGRIEEFHDERIESLQLEACRKKGFQLVGHEHRLNGYCRACSRKRAQADRGAPAASR
jgi:Fur family ferric uptake transcriptional regulator